MREQQPGPRHVPATRGWVRHNVLTTVLIFVMLGSVLVHVLTIGALVRVRLIVSQQLESSADQFAQVRRQEVRYDVPVDHTFLLETTIAISETVAVPFSMSVPITQTLRLPIQLSVPIRQTIRLPINTPIRRFEVPVPLDLTVPVSDTIDVPIDITVPISTTIAVPIRRNVPIKAEIPIETVIPVKLDLDDSPLGDLLKHLEDNLRELRNRLNE